MTILHEFGDLLRSMLASVPMPLVRAMVLTGLALLIVWVWSLPREVTEPPGGKKRWDENLRIGAIAALITQLLVYSLF